jgi:branched-chain amino acid transport system ATP-binding protein
MTALLLSLENFSCGYGRTRVVDELSLAVRERSLTTILGPNGAGKTSTIMAIMGHVQVQTGKIIYDGKDITNHRPIERAALKIAISPEGRELFGDLTVEENLIVGGYAQTAAASEDVKKQVFELFPRLRERRNQVARYLSGGEQQMLAIGRAMMAQPRLLLVDELSLGLMPKVVDYCMSALLDLKQSGITIVLVEQNTSRALAVSDHVCILAAGRCVLQGSAETVRDNKEIFDTYIGISSQESQPFSRAAGG